MKNGAHYQNLSVYHQRAYELAAKLAQATTDRDDAEARLREARKQLAKVHEVIVRYYVEEGGESWEENSGTDTESASTSSTGCPSPTPE